MRKKIFVLILTAILGLTGCSSGTVIVSNASGKSAAKFIEDKDLPAESEKPVTAASAPAKPAPRKVLSTIRINNADQKPVSADLTMDTVPDSYYVEPKQQGRIEKFYYMTNTYGLYGRKKEPIRKYAEVYLPYGYNPSKRYNIVYLMHGAGGSAERFFGSASRPRGLKAILDNLIALKQMKPMIFVSLTYYPKNHYKREADWDIQYTKYYDKELKNDVLPQVESHYSTYAKSTSEKDLIASRNHRMFGGYSMGCLTTYYRMADSMRYFHTFIAMCGSLYWGPDANGTHDVNFAADYLMKAIQKEGYTPDDFFVYAATGTKDFSLDAVKLQIKSEAQHPEFFRFGQSDKHNQTVSNCAFEIGNGEIHSGPHASDRYLYNVLPLLSKTVSDN